MSDTYLFLDEDEYELDGPGIDEESIEFGDERYTTKVVAPHYIPNGPCPLLSDIVNTTKYEELINKINKSNVGEDEKRFLRLAATRHIVFNFSKAANYYAYADKEMQQLMEDSVMVIIDFNNAVRNGFVRLDERVDSFIKEQLALEKSEEKDAWRFCGIHFVSRETRS